jgi:hypothetical protein
MASEQMLGPSGRSRHRDNAEVLEIGGQANRERGAGAWGRCRGTAELQDNGTQQTPRRTPCTGAGVARSGWAKHKGEQGLENSEGVSPP